MNIDGQVALVTGGASGLGEATARHLAALGADVAILDFNGERAAQVAAEIGGYSQPCDVTEADNVAAGVSAAMARFGQAPRIVVNCAGIGAAARIVGRRGQGVDRAVSQGGRGQSVRHLPRDELCGAGHDGHPPAAGRRARRHHQHRLGGLPGRSVGAGGLRRVQRRHRLDVSAGRARVRQARHPGLWRSPRVCSTRR